MDLVRENPELAVDTLIEAWEEADRDADCYFRKLDESISENQLLKELLKAAEEKAEKAVPTTTTETTPNFWRNLRYEGDDCAADHEKIRQDLVKHCVYDEFAHFRENLDSQMLNAVEAQRPIRLASTEKAPESSEYITFAGVAEEASEYITFEYPHEPRPLPEEDTEYLPTNQIGYVTVCSCGNHYPIPTFDRTNTICPKCQHMQETPF